MQKKINTFMGLSFGSINLWASTRILLFSRSVKSFGSLNTWNIYSYSNSTQSAEPLKSLKNTAVE